MSAVWENTNAIRMLNVEITLDPTAANVEKDFQEMAKRAQVSIDFYCFFRGHGNESCNLIGSLPGQYFPISAHGPR